MTDVQISASDVQVLMSYHLVSFFALTHSRPTHARALSCRLLRSAIHIVVCITEVVVVCITKVNIVNYSQLVLLLIKNATHTRSQKL